MNALMLNIAIVQIKNSTNKEENFKTIMGFLKQLETEEVDLILFPECALSGFSGKITECTLENLESYLVQIQHWTKLHNKSVVLPTAIVEDKIYNSGFYFNQGERQRFYKLGLTESELKFFSVPEIPTPKTFHCKGTKFALIICIEAEHEPWTYFKPGEAELILWPGYWGWEKGDEWNETKSGKDEANLIYKNMREWKLPLIQANFAYNDSADHRPTGPKGLSVVVDQENRVIRRGEHEAEGFFIIKI